MSKTHVFLLLAVSLVSSIYATSLAFKPAHALGYNGTGLVCITTSITPMNCPDSGPVIAPLSIGSTLTVGVFINNSLPMEGYDIYVATNNAILHPTKATLGTLIATPTLTAICVNGVAQTGTCTTGTANGPGVVEVMTIESSGSTECGGIPPCSGLAFTITYTVESLEGTQFSYPSAAGCGSGLSSVSPSSEVCVIVEDAFGTTLSENIQAATYAIGVDFSFSPTLPQIGQIVTFTPTVPIGTAPFSYSWTFGDGGASNLTSPTHIYSISGSFAVNVTLTDSSMPPRIATAAHQITLQPPDFTISATPSTIGPLAPNVVGSSNLTINGISLFTGTITLSLAPSPGLRISLSANDITINSTNPVTIVTVNVESPTPGAYSVLIVGSSAGFPTHRLELSINVGDFEISGPAAINILPSASNTTAQVKVSPLFGFESNVSLSISNVPGLTATITPSSISGSGIATLVVSGSPGIYTMVLTGSSPGFSSHTIMIQVNIGVDFTVSTSPIHDPIHPNEFTTTTVTVTSVNGFSGIVSLALIPSSGLIVSISSVSVPVAPGNPGTATLTLGSSTTGSFPLMIVATSSALPTHTAQLSLTVTSDPPPRFIRLGLHSEHSFSVSDIVAGLMREWLAVSILAVALVIAVASLILKQKRTR